MPNDPDYVDPARIAQLRDEGKDAGIKPARPSVRRPSGGTGIAMGSTARVAVKNLRVAKGVTIETKHVTITR